MQLTVNAKQLGRKRDLIDRLVIEIEDIGQEPTVAELISAVVIQQVREFNSRPNEPTLLPLLDQETSGKISFGSIYNDTKADPSEAVKTALLAFQDGLFVIFADEKEYTKSEQIIHLQEDTIITFIRLTFLAGSYW
ncbi:hypothetical protein SAMN05428988_4626 [Chitinophaga sp. YR573]|uniref:hypothetical protein n=1 Tax=Chitinophaga sp. YR573 TaxID=1881040 RepID=UPI0008AFBD55|nr:hypothetical protein [Chitinophaga sp. YR573]SEW37195.1 hypothetical protein SAMN05428988_4626 [Chitinophaga sp. YR573]